MSKSQVTNIPISDRMTRERTFEVSQKRPDRKDAIAQIIITLDDILTANFTGQIILNCHQGGVNSIQVRESEKVP